MFIYKRQYLLFEGSDKSNYRYDLLQQNVSKFTKKLFTVLGTGFQK